MPKLRKLIAELQHRYQTLDPFKIADKLNIQIEWVNIGKSPLGETVYYNHEPIILLNSDIADSNVRYFAVAHELGHAIEHADLTSYYSINRVNRGKIEVEADKFSIALLTSFYVEENGQLPEDYNDLVVDYGFPNIYK